MKFTEKPKTIEAVQFNSHENIGEIMRLCKPRAIRYDENPSGRTLMIWLNHGETANAVKPGQYVMLDPEAAQKRLIIVPEDEFEAKYQRVCTGSESSVARDGLARGVNPLNTLMDASGANLKLNGDGTITGIAISAPNSTTIRGIAGDPE